MKVVIVGGVAGGAGTAARLRRLDENAEIIMLERGEYISYANCGLPYYIGDTITDPEALTLQTPESFFSRFRITMKVRHEVTAIHTERSTVSVKKFWKQAQSFEESYDKLFALPGGQDLLFPLFRALTLTVSLPFAQWKTRSALRTMLIKRTPVPSYWQEEALSALSLQKISAISVWRLRLSSAQNSL